MRQKLLTSAIVVEERQRKDYGNVSRLAESIRKLGLIHPIVVTQDNRLIAGGRRLAACKQLGLESVDILVRETATEEELQELEYDENIQRLDISWQERCLAVARIHALKIRKAVLTDTSWGQLETSEIAGCSVGSVNWSLRIAKELADKDSPFWKMEQITEAIRFIFNREKDLALAELARRSVGVTNLLVPMLSEPTADSSQSNQTQEEAARERYLSNPHNDPEQFDFYWEEKQRLQQQASNVVYLSNSILHTDAISFLANHSGRFDHIVTDPPYAIDMDMLDQDGQSILNIDAVRDEHDVTRNTGLLNYFLPAAYAALKPSGYLVFWCDTMLWEFLYNAANGVGFCVQRWPLVWVKSHACKNSAAQFNFTKATELAMVCRKGNATLVKPATTNVIVAPHDGFKDKMDHPFVKPFACWRFILEHISYEGQTICEPFAGHGSGVLSMLQMNRNVIACEINKAHYNALLEHIKQHYLSLNLSLTFA